MGNHKVKPKEREKYQDLARELKKKTMEHEGDIDINYNWNARYNHQRISTRTGRLGNKMTSGDYPNYSLADID